MASEKVGRGCGKDAGESGCRVSRAIESKERHPGSVQSASCACVCDPVTSATLLLPSDS